MNQNRDTIIFVSVICGLLALAFAAVHVLGLESQVEATIRFFLFEHRNKTLIASIALYVLVLLIASAESIAGFIRRPARRNSTRLV